MVYKSAQLSSNGISLECEHNQLRFIIFSKFVSLTVNILIKFRLKMLYLRCSVLLLAIGVIQVISIPLGGAKFALKMNIAIPVIKMLTKFYNIISLGL